MEHIFTKSAGYTVDKTSMNQMYFISNKTESKFSPRPRANTCSFLVNFMKTFSIFKPVSTIKVALRIPKMIKALLTHAISFLKNLYQSKGLLANVRPSNINWH